MTHRSVLSIKFVLGCGLSLAMFSHIDGAAAKGLSVVYAFQYGSDGAFPWAGLIMDGAGNLFGTTSNGGTNGRGTVFELAPNGTETVLYHFQGKADAGNPYTPLIEDKKGNLYGTTEIGGTSARGTVFKLMPDGKEKVLYSFKGGAADGRFPFSGLVRDSAGNLYGTTYEGGGTGCANNTGCGTVYKLASDGTETVLYAFQGPPDAEYPYGALVIDQAGNLYGTTELGGSAGSGTVFKVTPDGTETVLYSFQGEPDGGFPQSGLIADKNGNLYGTTSFGGTNGGGTVFEIVPDGTETVLHSFGGFGTTDGDLPVGGVIRDKSGNLFGTTESGGAHDRGTVFRLAPDGTETMLASFVCSKDGCNPHGALIADQAGNLYGTATNKGPVTCPGVGKKPQGCGTVFNIHE